MCAAASPLCWGGKGTKHGMWASRLWRSRIWSPDASMVCNMKCAFCKFCRMSKSGVLHLQYNFQPPDGGMPPNSDSDVPNMANLFLDCIVYIVSGVTILCVEYHNGTDGSLPLHVDTNVMLWPADIVHCAFHCLEWQYPDHRQSVQCTEWQDAVVPFSKVLLLLVKLLFCLCQIKIKH